MRFFAGGIRLFAHVLELDGWSDWDAFAVVEWILAVNGIFVLKKRCRQRVSDEEKSLGTEREGRDGRRVDHVV